MAMSLKALRPVLWSTRLVSTPPRLCVLAYHKQHLLTERGMSTLSLRATLAHCSSAPIVGICPGAQHGFSTRASSSAQTAIKDDDTKPTADVVQMSNTKTVEEVLQLVNDYSLSPTMASFAMQQLVLFCRESPDGWTNAHSKIAKDPRYIKLTKTLLDSVSKLSSRYKTNTLINCCRMRVPNKNAVIDILVPDLRSRLRSMDVNGLTLLVSNHNVLKGNQHTKDLVYESARVLQLRWREMDALPPRIYCRLLAVSRPFPRDYKTFISDKVLESVDKFTFSELVDIATTLMDLPLRNRAVLQAIAYQAIRLVDQWEVPLVYKLLESMAVLRFHHQPLTQQIALYIESNKSQWTPSLVTSIARSFMLLRIPHPGLFDAICSYAQENLADFNFPNLSLLLFAFGDIGYQPRNKSAFYEMVLARMQPSEFQQNSDIHQKTAAYSLMVCDQLPDFILKEVLQTRDSDTENADKQRFSDVLLRQINTHARLLCPEYQGPYMESNPSLPGSLNLTSLQESVRETLQKALGNGDVIKTNVWTTLGYKLDALVLMNDANKPVIVDEYQMPDLPVEKDSQDKTPIPEGYQRIAVLVWPPKCMLVDSETLTGRSIMQKKHIQAAGYKTVEVTFRQWNQAKTDFQKLSLIKFKLAEAILIK